MRVEGRDDIDGAVVLARDDTMEHRTMQPSTWRVGINPFERSHPGLVLQQTGHSGAEFTAHPAHEHPDTNHDPQR
jgi:hypothetical protein